MSTHVPTPVVSKAKAGLPVELRALYFLLIVAFVVQVGWTIGGGMLLRETGTAMCPEVCVGSLVIDRPLAAHSDVRRGETVSIVEPGTRSLVTRRVVDVFANGTFEVKADSSHTREPWVLSPADVKGVSVATVWGLGWLGTALAFMAVGAALLLLVRRHIDTNVRRVFDRLFFVVLVALPLWVMNPLIRSSVVKTRSLGAHLARLELVNTGLLPAQFTASGGQFKDFIAPGRDVALSGRVQPDGLVSFSQFVSFRWWGWAIVLVVILVPLALVVREIAAAQWRSNLANKPTRSIPARRAGSASPATRESVASRSNEEVLPWAGGAPRRPQVDTLPMVAAGDHLFAHNDVANNFEHFVDLSPKEKKKKKGKSAKSKSARRTKLTGE